LLAFLLEAVLVSLSGVMAPGPLSATVVARGSESPHAGAVVAIGHGIVELPLMACILLGLGFLLEQFYVRVAMALVGGLFLSVMGVGMLRSIKRAEFAASKSTRSSMVAGIVLSAGNPYLRDDLRYSSSRLRAASEAASASRMSYRCVVDGRLCPASLPTTKMSAPALSKLVRYVRLESCGLHRSILASWLRLWKIANVAREERRRPRSNPPD